MTKDSCDGVSYLYRENSEGRKSTNPLVDVELAEDLGRVQQVLVVENPSTYRLAITFDLGIRAVTYFFPL